MRRHKRTVRVIPPDQPEARDEGPRLIPLRRRAADDHSSRIGYYVQLANSALGLPSDSYPQQRSGEGNETLKPVALKLDVGSHAAKIAAVNQAGVNFLKVDLDTGLTFVAMARQANNLQDREHYRECARRVYDSILRLVHRVDLPKADERTLMRKLQRLKSELENLGDAF